MLLMVEKGIRGGICHSVYRYAKANNKYMKDYDRKKESLYHQNQDINNLYDWAMLQKLPVNSFQQIKHAPQFIKDFIKKYKRQSNKGYFFEVDVQYTEKLHELRSDLPFLSKNK